MKISKIIVVGFISIMSIVVVFSFLGESNVPEIQDTIDTSDSVKINLSPNDDNLDVKDSANIELNDNTPSYWVDEDGKKHYTLSAADTPTIQE